MKNSRKVNDELINSGLSPEQLDHLSTILSNYSVFAQETTLSSEFLVSPSCLTGCAMTSPRQLGLEFTFPFAWQYGFLAMKNELEPIILEKLDLDVLIWNYQQEIAIFKPLKKVSGVKHIIAVSSGKGGVGKSSITANLAAGLLVQGAKVGILDADIYGPSIPTMFGLEKATLSSLDGKWMEPVKSFGIATNSIGYLTGDDNAMIWRGPMASKALIQLLQETNWPDLDYLILDMPPGTGDVQITLGQQVELSGAIVVTTPQDIALIDAKKGVKMFREVKVPLLGLVENMSWHICDACGYTSYPFGMEGAQKYANGDNIQFLGQIPLDIALREDSDAGCPTVLGRPLHPITQIFISLAAKISAINYLDVKKKQQSEIPMTFLGE